MEQIQQEKNVDEMQLQLETINILVKRAKVIFTILSKLLSNFTTLEQHIIAFIEYYTTTKTIPSLAMRLQFQQQLKQTLFEMRTYMRSIQKTYDVALCEHNVLHRTTFVNYWIIPSTCMSFSKKSAQSFNNLHNTTQMLQNETKHNVQKLLQHGIFNGTCVAEKHIVSCIVSMLQKYKHILTLAAANASISI